MSRFLLVALPLAGHTNAALAIGDALRAAGHDVAWCGPESYLRPLVGPDATVYPTGMRYYRQYAETGMTAIKLLWEGYLLPVNRFILAATDRAVEAYRPDVLVVDQYAFAGAMVAHRHGLPWATVCTGGMELTRPSPEMDELVHGQLARLWAMADLPADERLDLRFSPYLVIGLTSAALTADVPLPPKTVLVGPALGDRPTDPSFDWDWLDPARQHVLVTVGTSSEHMALDFYPRMVAALAPLADRLQAVLIASADAVPDPPAHILVVPRVPMLALMPQFDAVVCHSGLGTVTEALAYGVPLVVAPMRHDQPIVADQVVRAGAGVRVSFDEATPEQLAAAVCTVLDDPSYRESAGRIADSFTAAGGAHAAAEHLIGMIPER